MSKKTEKDKTEKDKTEKAIFAHSKKLELNCPCCKKVRGIKELSKVIAQVIPLMREGDTPDYYIRGTQWACDSCLSKGKANAANIHCHHLAHCGCPSWILAYVDQERSCTRCQNKFLFDKDEQRYWYEELNFYMASVPNECPPCRKAIRDELRGQRRLSGLLPRFRKGEVDFLETIVQIYLEMDKPESAHKFLASASKLYANSTLMQKRIKTIKVKISKK